MFQIENLSASTVSKFNIDDWIKGGMKYPPLADKPAWTTWTAAATTKWSFFSGYEGVNAALRVSRDLYPVKLWAIVADYDAATDKSEWQAVLDRANDYPPNYVGRTFSGNLRLVWTIDKALLVPKGKPLEAFLKKVAKTLRMSKLAAGWDEAAFFDECKYYESGESTAWAKTDAPPLDSGVLNGWLIESGANAKWTASYENLGIPIEVIAAEVESRWPGRWRGEFVAGARGVRFWDDAADNHTAAIVRPNGMQCFTGEQPFVPWRDILGKKFCEEYECKKLGEATGGLACDANHFHFKSPDGCWRQYPRDFVITLLKNRGLSAKPNGTKSQIDTAMLHIHTELRFDKIVPLIHQPEIVIDPYTGQRTLNTSTVKLRMPQEGGPIGWADGFSFISSFYDGYFASEKQLKTHFAWFKRGYCTYYEGARNGTKHDMGQILAMFGPVQTGKSLLTQHIIGAAFGGWVDAIGYFTKDQNFTSELTSSPLWVVDDSTPSASIEGHRRYTSLLKKMAAQTAMLHNAKYGAAHMVDWAGRIVVLGNDDPVSIRALPSLEGAVLDKFIVLRIADRKFQFPASREETEARIAAELPAFLRWLRHWEPDAEVLDRSRYGVISYFDEQLKSVAAQSEETRPLRELLDNFFEEYFKLMETDKTGKKFIWKGTATKLYMELHADPGRSQLVAKYSNERFAHLLTRVINEGSMQFKAVDRAAYNRHNPYVFCKDEEVYRGQMDKHAIKLEEMRKKVE